MSVAGDAAEVLRGVESVMLESFRREPFHNFRLLYGDHVADHLSGGTCSDKTLSFVELGRRRGFDVSLHSGYIDGEEMHRLARVNVGGRSYFADIGNGWPALKLYPADREVAFRCFGIGFRTEVAGTRLSVFCERQGRESLQVEVDVRCQSEDGIRAAIERRFTSGIVYPFSKDLRFSLVVQDRFLFLRGQRLEIYRQDGVEEISGIRREDVPLVLFEYFGYDLRSVDWRDK